MSKEKKKSLLIIAVVFILLALFSLYRNQKSEDLAMISIGGVSLTAEIADETHEREKGLSERNNLQENTGLLFVFPETGQHFFWMKDMNFPIDIIWLDEKGEIVGLTRDFRPETYPQTITSKKPARLVMETNAGFIDARNLKEGDRAIISWPNN